MNRRQRRDRILVVCHEASRTGAPRVVVDLLGVLGDEGFERVAIARWGGPLVDELRAVSDHYAYEPLRRIRAGLRRWSRTRALAVRVEESAAALTVRRFRPDVVYANTVLSASYVGPARRMGIPVVLHVHELAPLATAVLARYELDWRDPGVHLVACSESARTDLAGITGAPAQRIDVLTSPVDVERVTSIARREPSSSTGAETSTVVACGTADVRKGVDLWLEAAAEVRRLAPERDVRFVWVGPRAWPPLSDRIEQLGLNGVVHVTGEVADPYPLIAQGDVFTLSSRMDPFPLVVLEAMALGRPVVAFDAGGVTEQLGRAGVLVPPEDPAAMAEAVVALLRADVERARLGQLAEQRVTSRYGIEPFRTTVTELLDGVLAREGGTV